MPKLDYEKLLGGYATGTLTEAECDALFGAALHDQALFNALADDQALKELLDDPESRRRLIAALEAAEGTQEKPNRWGVLVPSWLPLPAIARPAQAEPESLYVSTTFPQTPPKIRSWRGVLAGGLILSVLAVIVAAGLIEEMMSPPQPVLTADAGREEPATPAETPAPEVPAVQVLPTVPPVLEQPPTPSPDRRSNRDQVSEVLEKSRGRKALPARSFRDSAPRPAASELQRQQRTVEQTHSSSPRTFTATPSEERAEVKVERPSESALVQPTPDSRAAPGAEGPPVVSARAAFYAGSDSLESSRQVSTQGRAMPEETGESQHVAALRAESPEKSGAARMPASLSPMVQPPVRHLGMRYSVVKKTAGGADQEISPATMLNSDDETHLTIEVNRSGYLYVLKRTLPEVWTVLYPSLGRAADPAGRAAYVHSGTRYVIPSSGSLTGAVLRGTIELVILFAKDPQSELGSLGNEPPERDKAQSRRIGELIRRIRTEVARGKLISERAEPGAVEMQAEQAVYVVDHSPIPLGKLLADIMLSFR